ncbi:glycosyltransferase [Desulfovibrio sp. UIB00]|uniref:glycosyltransferase n=1 Tax=Desulfovibrio sp. UIB00 TaxID=2804314 RepID=UPI001F0DBEF2|nr:glycosyltransferase [Desulfovibrio sp. UIB00]
MNNRSQSSSLVSIFMPTYNHAPFIEEAMNGCLSQKTTFPFELIICDDFSTDGTREIVSKWAKKYSNITLSLQDHNTRGIRNMLDGLALARSKYLAICEGDDLWSADDKLQRQVTFLEEHSDFTVCCHKVELLYMDNPLPSSPHYIYKDCSADDERIRQGIFFADEVVDNYYLHTSSMLFRWQYSKGLPTWFRPRMLLDHFLFLLIASNGKIKYFDEPMSKWRRHDGGYSFSQLHDKGVFFQKEGGDWITCYRLMDKFFHGRFHLQIRERILLALRAITDNCIKTGQLDQLRELLHKNWDYIKKPVLENASLLDAIRLLYPENRDFFPPWTCTSSNQRKLDSQNKEQELRPILGGGHGLDFEVVPQVADSIWNHWTQGQEYATFGNARAALAAFCYAHGVRCVWVPSCCPSDVVAALTELQLTCRYYALQSDLEPSLEFLSSASPGDMILTICWFGKPLSAVASAEITSYPNLLWVEDRAQCLSCPPSKASAVIYSPRKVVGVPDGGIMVGAGVARMQPGHAENSEGLHLQALVAKCQEFEKVAISPFAQRCTLAEEFQSVLPQGPASRLTQNLLRRLPWEDVVSVRRTNWETLYSALHPFALWPLPSPDFGPNGFPLILPPTFLAAAVVTTLANNGVRVSRMWLSKFPSELDPNARKMRDSLIVLPCDHRYSGQDMEYIAGLVSAIISGNGAQFNRSQRSES